MKRAVPVLLGIATLWFATAGAQTMDHGDAKDKHQAMWNKLDADGNGSVSRQEYTDAMSKHFDRADSNSDGEISQQEWQARKEAMRSQMDKERPAQD